jgi:integrase
MPRAKLTDKLLQSSKRIDPATGQGVVPATGQIDYWDQLTPGFGVRVSYGGRKAFQVLARINGKLQRFTLGAYPRISLAEARDQAERMLKDAAAGISPKDREIEERNKTQAQRLNSFGKVAAEFMIDHAKGLRTRDEMQRMLDRELLPVWGDRPIASITRAEVKALLRAKAQVAPIAANRLASLISKLFNWALDEEIVTASPAVRLKRAEEHERERSLTEDEIRALWPAFDRIGYPFGAALKLLLVTGQRRGEVAGLRWSDLNGDGWLLPGSSAKSKQGHRVPLSSLALEIIESCPRIGERVFVGHKGAGAINGWEDAKARAESFLANPIAPWRIHDLRRTMATQMRSIGIDRLIVSKLLNHAESGITKIYDRFSADPEKAAAMERWANRLREIVGAGGAVDNVVLLELPAAS